ncbi:MAG: SAM-dependent methyltransferase [Pirellula sp.]|nr:SAM-dependent methyltransferase [Pirellula sp.]
MTTDGSNRWDARLYDDRHAFVWRSAASLVELLAPQRGERILDVGCGTGHLTAQLAAAGAEAVGIDASATMIEEARRNHPGAQFFVADARDYRADEPFDAVFSNAALHWVRPPEAAVRTIHSALRPGGRFVAEFGGCGNVARVVAALRRLQGEFFPTAAIPDWYFPSVAEYASLLEAAGLETREAWLFDRPTPLEGNDGLRSWARMFATDAVAAVDTNRAEEFFSRLEAELRSELFRDGGWFADYRRLRITAVRIK